MSDTVVIRSWVLVPCGFAGQMPTFWRSMLSASSRAEVTRQGSRGLIQDLKNKG
jgi:hypothetical protein